MTAAKRSLGNLNIFSTFVHYVRNSIHELKNVTWPTRTDIIRHSLIILISIAIATGIIAAVDYGLSLLSRYLLVT